MTSSVIVAMDAGERIRRFGIECIGSSGGDGIFFQAGKWRPGKFFIGFLIFHNFYETRGGVYPKVAHKKCFYECEKVKVSPAFHSILFSRVSGGELFYASH